jgi:glutaryl-CoA dehydrogenase
MEDFLLLDELLTDEERLIREQVRNFVDQEVIPKMQEAYEQAKFPQELIPKLAELGLLGVTLPEQFGGANANATMYGLVCQELERGDSGLRSFVSVQNSLCMYPIFAFGSEEQKNRFLFDMAQGKKIGCFGLTEPDSGSDPASMRTKAEQVEGGWVLNGSKMWITNATLADLAIVWAKTTAGIRGFIVERDFAGFSRNSIHHKMSMRASDTGELIFSNCFVPEKNYLPGTEKGLAAALSCLTKARFGIAWGAMGAAMACFETTLNYAKERKQFNKPIAAFQLVQNDFANMFTEIVKTQTFNLRMGRLADQNKITPVMVSMAKMNGARAALKIARTCRNLLGANGISLEYHVIRHLENLETVFTYEGTDNIHHLVLGKYLTGIDAFS